MPRGCSPLPVSNFPDLTTLCGTSLGRLAPRPPHQASFSHALYLFCLIAVASGPARLQCSLSCVHPPRDRLAPCDARHLRCLSRRCGRMAVEECRATRALRQQSLTLNLRRVKHTVARYLIGTLYLLYLLAHVHVRYGKHCRSVAASHHVAQQGFCSLAVARREHKGCWRSPEQGLAAASAPRLGT
ncbi:hypothetical protein FA95DRAFT_91322 [Auriscalpium vulgare]|uniref:Uncharacterized protein n=1 Tax=Auriscalpium vulgare TaxID=40419 RepID=A0ACB8RP71_9AGAM|nr:hypothetical protein FA95DRAFT_91322 [Auriscalpium vulgare]